MNKFLKILAENPDIRSLGGAQEVLQEIRDDEHGFENVFEGIFSPEPVVRLRSIDIVEKVSHRHPQWLAKRKSRILNNLDAFDGHDVQQMHIALMAENLGLTPSEAEILLRYLNQWSKKDQKWIRCSCITGAGLIAKCHPQLKARAVKFIKNLAKSDGSPSVTKRSELVLADLRL